MLIIDALGIYSWSALLLVWKLFSFDLCPVTSVLSSFSFCQSFRTFVLSVHAKRLNYCDSAGSLDGYSDISLHRLEVY